MAVTEVAMSRGLAAARYLVVLAVLYAAMPVATAAIWFATAPGGSLLRHPQVELVLVFEVVALLAALRLGLSRRFLSGLLTRWEALALALLAAILVATGILVAEDPARAFERLGVRALIPLAGVALYYLAMRDRSGAAPLAPALVLQPIVHLPVVIGLYLAYGGAEPPEINWRGGPIGYWHVRIWGMALAAAGAAAFGLYAAGPRTPVRHAAAFAVLALLAGLLCWSGSRGSILGLLGGVALTAAVFPRRAARALPVTLAAFAAGALVSLLPEPPHPAYGLGGYVAESLGAADADRATAGRLGIWRDALALVGERPLFGHGHDQYALIYEDFHRPLLHPHNAVLQIMIDVGIVGFAAAAFLMLSLLWRGAARIRAEGAWSGLAGFAVLGAMAGASMFDGVLYHEVPLLIVALGYVLLFAAPGQRLERAGATG